MVPVRSDSLEATRFDVNKVKRTRQLEFRKYPEAYTEIAKAKLIILLRGKNGQPQARVMEYLIASVSVKEFGISKLFRHQAI